MLHSSRETWLHQLSSLHFSALRGHMGGEASKPAQKVAAGLRKAGDPLNTLGYPAVHEKFFQPPLNKSIRQNVCRCWLSLKFPLCDNTHQRLQRQLINVGPVMLEIKPLPMNTGAQTCCGGDSAGHHFAFGGGHAFALGGVSAFGLLGATAYGASSPF